MTTQRTLAQWLAILECRHPVSIDLGLERVGQVAEHLGLLDRPVAERVITVAGTNGKGSTVAMIEAVARAHGLTTAAYTSPHLLRYNERLTRSGVETPDADWVRAFEHIETVRGDISLTYFETGTLAALWLIAEQRPELAVLEVGLGGRLDAVNVLDADVAVVTTVDHDHADFLGNDLNIIGYEKAGIMRPGRPAVLGSRAMVASVAEHAAALPVSECLALGQSFDISHQHDTEENVWQWRGAQAGDVLESLPDPGLPLDNAATALQALRSAGVALQAESVRQGLTSVSLPGRLQWLGTWCLDVAHNPHAARYVAKRLAARPPVRRVALLGMLSGKDTDGVIDALAPCIDGWVVATLEGPRGLEAERLAERLAALGADVWQVCASPEAGVCWLKAHDAQFDEVLVCGSFLTVAGVLAMNEMDERSVEEKSG